MRGFEFLACAGAEALQLGERAVVGTFGGIDAALQAREAVAGAAVDVAERSILVQAEGGGARVLDLVGPELGFETAEALKLPVGVDELVDQEALEVGGRRPILVIAGDHGFELGEVLAGDDLGLGVDAGLEGVEARGGLPLGRARAGGVLRIATIRLELT